MKEWWQVGQAASAQQATQKVYLSIPRGIELPTSFRFIVDDLSTRIHKQIARDIDEDPSMLIPDVPVIEDNPFPDRGLAEMDTVSVGRAQHASADTIAEEPPIWSWEYEPWGVR